MPLDARAPRRYRSRVVTSSGVLEKSEDMIAALEALRSRLSDEDRSTVEETQAFIADVKKFVSTMDGQLAAMRFLAQKQFRPKSDQVPPGQLALDLLGFMLAQRKQEVGGDAPSSAGDEEALPKAPPREKRTSKMHLVPVVPACATTTLRLQLGQQAGVHQAQEARILCQDS